VYDLYRIVRDNVIGNCDNLGTNLTALGVDFGAAFVPGVTGAGIVVRAGKNINKFKYTPKVLKQIESDIYHGFPSIIDEMAINYGKKEKIIGGDGIERTRIILPGAINGKKGRYEWIVEPDGSVNHRFFRISK